MGYFLTPCCEICGCAVMNEEKHAKWHEYFPLTCERVHPQCDIYHPEGHG